MNRETKPAGAGADAPRAPGLLTVPNVLSAARLAGSPFLVVFALADNPTGCLVLFVVLWLTDWFDGLIAIRFNLRTAFGARLDSAADATFYAATGAAVCLLEWDLVRREAAWIGAAVVSYLVSVAAGLVRFRRVPSYHTRLAKTSWLLVGVAVVGVFAGRLVWPLRVAAAVVVLTNLEATAITAVSRQWRTDVASVYHALRTR